MKKKPAFDPPRSPSLWPKPVITEKTDAQTIVSTIPGYIERARDALMCVDSRCDSARRKGVDQSEQVNLEGVRGHCKMILEQLTMMRKSIDGMIAEKQPVSELF